MLVKVYTDGESPVDFNRVNSARFNQAGLSSDMCCGAGGLRETDQPGDHGSKKVDRGQPGQ
jgi:hypothetical protein